MQIDDLLGLEFAFRPFKCTLNNPIDSNTKPRAMVSTSEGAEHESECGLIIRDEKQS